MATKKQRKFKLKKNAKAFQKKRGGRVVRIFGDPHGKYKVINTTKKSIFKF